MNNSGDNTHKPQAASPESFRAQATGIGSTRAASLRTGAVRAAEVAATIPTECRAAVPAAEGYPPPAPYLLALVR